MGEIFNRKHDGLLDNQNTEQEVIDLTDLFNLTGVVTEFTPDMGWSCRLEPEKGIVITVDPNQIKTTSGEVQNEHVLFVARHELSHAADILTKDWDRHTSEFEKDGFFWNYAHDIVIDGRTVKDYRGYAAVAPELYNKLFSKKNLTKSPKHIQLMQGLRCQVVLGEKSELKLDEEVQEAISGIRNYNGHDITEVMIHRGTSLKQRIDLARKFIKPVYDQFYEEDKQKHSKEDLEKQTQTATQQGDLTGSASGNAEGNNEDSTFEKQLEEAIKDHKDKQQLEDLNSSEYSPDQEEKDQQSSAKQDKEKEEKSILSSIKDTLVEKIIKGKENFQPTEEKDQFISDLAGTIKSEFELSEGDAEAYAISIYSNRRNIKTTAEIFKYLARIDHHTSRLQDRRESFFEGTSLHTGRLPQAIIEMETGSPMEIWHRRERSAPRTTKTFNGLDIELLIDVSVSMDGSPAQKAAEVALILTEGLLLARKQQSEMVNGRLPDVRVGGMLFAGSTETVIDLTSSPSPKDRAKMFTNTRKAGKSSTLVAPGLGNIADIARRFSNRDVISIVISDNDFGDKGQARQSVRSMPPNCQVFNFSIGGGNALGEKAYCSTLESVDQMPSEFLRILKQYQRRFEDV